MSHTHHFECTSELNMTRHTHVYVLKREGHESDPQKITCMQLTTIDLQLLGCWCEAVLFSYAYSQAYWFVGNPGIM